MDTFLSPSMDTFLSPWIRFSVHGYVSQSIFRNRSAQRLAQRHRIHLPTPPQRRVSHPADPSRRAGDSFNDIGFTCPHPRSGVYPTPPTRPAARAIRSTAGASPAPRLRS